MTINIVITQSNEIPGVEAKIEENTRTDQGELVTNALHTLKAGEAKELTIHSSCELRVFESEVVDQAEPVAEPDKAEAG